MKAIIGKKIGMTSIFDAEGKAIPCTVIEANPSVVTQIKTVATDGYDAVQIGYGDKKEKNTTKAELGHFKKAGVSPQAMVIEFRGSAKDLSLGSEIGIDILAENDKVTIIGTSKGKGFQGVVKRHHFSGVGGATHGQHNRLRAPGSLGACSTPSRVMKGMKMGGRMGNDRVKQAKMKIVKILADQNLFLIKGSVPGHNGAYVIIEK